MGILSPELERIIVSSEAVSRPVGTEASRRSARSPASALRQADLLVGSRHELARLGMSVVLLTVALVGCGGEDGAMKLTLRDDECVYEGATSRDAGSLTIDVNNESNRFGHVAVATLLPGATTADIQPFLDAAWREFRRTGESLAAPWETVSVDRAIPGDERFLEFEGKAGSYLLLCFVDTDQDFGQDEPEDVPPAEVHIAAELQVHAR